MKIKNYKFLVKLKYKKKNHFSGVLKWVGSSTKPRQVLLFEIINLNTFVDTAIYRLLEKFQNLNLNVQPKNIQLNLAILVLKF